MKEKVFVLGLDGASLDLLKPWAEEGKLLNFKKIIDNGVSGKLETVVPPITPVAWSSIITGKNPGKHGIFDFLCTIEGSHDLLPVNANNRDGKTIWRLLNENGQKVGVFNVPLTYPPEEVNGFLISGWMTPSSARDYIYPPIFAKKIGKKMGAFHSYPKTVYETGKPGPLLKELHHILDMDTNNVIQLIKEHDWDFFMTVFFGTSIVQHQLWHLMDKTHPNYRKDEAEKFGNTVLKYFKHVDKNIGKIIEALGSATNIMIISDHGYGPRHKMVHLNNFLLQKGYLHLKKDILTRTKLFFHRLGYTPVNTIKFGKKIGVAKIIERRSYDHQHKWLKKLMRHFFLSFNDVDWKNSKAYSYGRSYGAIFLNLNKEKNEIEYKNLRDEIKRRIESFTDPSSGKRIAKVFIKEEIYKGPYLDKAPDLVIEPLDATYTFFGLTDFGSNKLVENIYLGATCGSATHRLKGLFLAKGPLFNEGCHIENLSVFDITPTILYLMKCKIPSDLDGRVLKEAIKRSYLKKVPTKFTDISSSTSSFFEKQNADNIKDIEKKLRELGYLG